MDRTIVLGFDIGGTKIGVGLVSDDGKILGSRRIENVDTYPEDILPQLADAAKALAAENQLEVTDLAGFGISAPGPADVANGVLTAPPNNPHWRNVPLLQYLKDQLGIPGCFENDANCGALAEGFFGAGRGINDFIYLTMSTGIGAGIVTGGTLVRGTGLYGGEFGHAVIEIHNGRRCGCGMSGCYEAYCSGRNVAKHVQELVKDRPDHPAMKLAGGQAEKIDMRIVEQAFRAGDPLMAEVWDEMSLRNAQAMGILINTFNPKRLILGTLAWAIGDIYMDPIRKYLPRFCWQEMLKDCELVPSELRREISSYAGAAAALYFLLHREF